MGRKQALFRFFVGVQSFLDLLLHFRDITEKASEIAQVIAEMPCRVHLLGHLMEAGFGDGDGVGCLSHGNSLNYFWVKREFYFRFSSVNPSLRKLMLAAIFIEDDDELAIDKVDDTPSATVECNLAT